MKNIDNSGIYLVDAEYHRPELASIHIIRSQDRLAIVDTGTQYSVDKVSAAIKKLGLSHDNIDYVILTHIHLDHAGGASLLMQLCENAQLVVHPRGARHMADPSKLIAGATAVYGQQEFDRLYGEINAIEPTRMIEPADGQQISLAGRSLEFIDTPGHASHHHCIVDHQSESVFTGDTLGISYRALRNDQHAFLCPTTTPVQFNPEALHASIEKVMAYQPKTLYLTHYSALKPSARMIAGLHEQIDDLVLLTQQVAEQSDGLGIEFENKLKESCENYLVTRCCNELDNVSEEVARKWLRLDAELNAQGLAFWWQHKRVA